jgi:hypothetical protein
MVMRSLSLGAGGMVMVRSSGLRERMPETICANSFADLFR